MTTSLLGNGRLQGPDEAVFSEEQYAMLREVTPAVKKRSTARAVARRDFIVLMWYWWKPMAR